MSASKAAPRGRPANRFLALQSSDDSADPGDVESNAKHGDGENHAGAAAENEGEGGGEDLGRGQKRKAEDAVETKPSKKVAAADAVPVEEKAEGTPDVDAEGSATEKPARRGKAKKATASGLQPGAVGYKKTLPGGVTTEVLRAGEEGARVAAQGDVVKLLYAAYLKSKDGKAFDDGDIDFVLGDGSMVPGFDAGVVGMRVGERRLIFIPSKLGYGKTGRRPKVPPHTNLVFDATLAQAGCDWTDMRKIIPSDPRRKAMDKKRRNAQRKCKY